MRNEAYSEFRALAKAESVTMALVLGSGLGDVPSGMEEVASLSFAEVPGFANTAVAGHAGRLVLGRLNGRTLLVFRGRFHRYEGHGWEQVERPVEVAAECGARTYLATNAAGGIADALQPGSLMLLTGHRWWLSPTVADRVHREPYSARLRMALRRTSVELHEGVYVYVTGPSYETPAEIRAMRAAGADAVGMSTAREMEAAYRLGMEGAAISCITNRAAGLSGSPLNHREVLEVASQQASRLSVMIAEGLELTRSAEAL